MITLKSDTSADTIVGHWAQSVKRKGLIRISNTYNPLDVFTKIIAFAKNRNAKRIILVTDRTFYLNVYESYFKSFPEFQCEIKLYSDILDAQHRHEYDLLLCDFAYIDFNILTQLSNKLKSDRYFISAYKYHTDAEYNMEIEAIESNELPEYLYMYDFDKVDRDKYLEYDKYIIDTYRIFKSLTRHFHDPRIKQPVEAYDVIRYCMYGLAIEGSKASATSVCQSIAKAEGWHKDMVGDSKSNRVIIANFHPDNLHDMAKNLNRAMSTRKELINRNDALIRTMKHIAYDVDADVLSLVDSTKTAEYATSRLNGLSSSNNYVALAVGNNLTTRTLRDFDTGAVILAKNGNQKFFGTVSQTKFVKEAARLNMVNLFIGSHKVKVSNVPSSINYTMSSVINSSIANKFGKLEDLSSLLDGCNDSDELSELKGHIWIVPALNYINDGTVVMNKPYSDLIKMQSNPNCNRLICVTDMKHLIEALKA